jgi:diguanylate cyclase (GGDEF)-like protein
VTSERDETPGGTGISSFVVLAGLALLTLVGVAFRDTPYPRLAIISPITYFVAMLGSFATVAVLPQVAADWHRPRAVAVMSLSYLVSGVLAAGVILVLPMLPLEPALIASGTSSGVWLILCWNALAAIGAFAYAALRDGRARSLPATPHFLAVARSVALFFVVASFLIAFVFANWLPPLVSGGSLQGAVTSGVSPAIALFSAAATIRLFLLRGANSIERAFAFSMLALTLGSALVLIGHERYTLGFYAGRSLVLVAGSFVIIAAIRTLISARMALARTQLSLTVSREESTKRAERIRALWNIASAETPSNGRGDVAILEVATSAVRRGHAIFGYLSHLEGERVVVDATAWNGSNGAHASAEHIYPGLSFPMHGSRESFVLSEGKASAWSLLADGAAGEGAEKNWRSLIASPIEIEGTSHFLMFGSTEPMTADPYAEDDLAYVDVVASIVAHRLRAQQEVERVQFHIEHDALTGLANRVHFRKAIREAIAAGQPFAVGLIDLDGFRFLNEREGYQIGDDVLVEVASGLRAAAPGALVARLSGDEFGVLAPLAEDEPLDTCTNPLQELFKAPFLAGERGAYRMLWVRASIGVARYPVDAEEVESLLRRVDVALDIAKERGGSSLVVFDAAMAKVVEERHVQVTDVADGIAKDQFVLAYQPTFNLATRAIVGAEALVRWNHPVRGMLPPGQFIRFAERNGLIGALSRWVLERIAKDMAKISLPPAFRCYMNVAPGLLEDFSFIAAIERTAGASAPLAGHLGVEITETTAMQNVQGSISTLALFRGWGLTVAVDDFGTGYSSLSYLKQLVVDLIKIDKSFVDGLPDDQRDGQLAEALIRIAQSFGYATLAEGIETERQAEWLSGRGCVLGQGYLVGRPMPFDAFSARLAAGS